jgi:hypothetical protein
LFLETHLGLGLVHTQDMGLAAKALELGVWAQSDVLRAELPTRYGYIVSPAQSSQPLHKS